jgi:hypothetical protein
MIQTTEGIGCAWAALVGWYITEGHSRYGGRLTLYQSESANPDKVIRIRQLLREVNAEFRETRRERQWRGRPSIQIEWHVRGRVALRLQALAPCKSMTPHLAGLPVEDAASLLDALIDGDGHRRPDGRCSIIQKDKASIELMQLLAIRLGYRAILRLRAPDGMYVLYITRGHWLTLRGTNGKESPLPRQYYTGIVWCPSVPSGFWLARRDGKPFITGNTYPTKLPTICIKAGTSEAGVCPACGAPWKRLLRKQPFRGKTKSLYPEGSMANRARSYQQGLREQGFENAPLAEHTGWVMTCDCPYSKPAPALVLDPFSGAGTTGLAALRLRRSYVGHEASETYAQMSRERIRGESPMFFTEVKKSDEEALPTK